MLLLFLIKYAMMQKSENLEEAVVKKKLVTVLVVIAVVLALGIAGAKGEGFDFHKRSFIRIVKEEAK